MVGEGYSITLSYLFDGFYCTVCCSQLYCNSIDHIIWLLLPETRPDVEQSRPAA